MSLISAAIHPRMNKCGRIILNYRTRILYYARGYFFSYRRRLQNTYIRVLRRKNLNFKGGISKMLRKKAEETKEGEKEA